ncbi:MAG: response regulator [Acidobacteria bacterium]|nr:response regulator [Acidobacteriota bacterium]
MGVPLKVLVLEDHPDEAFVVIASLRRFGYEPEWQRVDSETDYVRLLDELDPQLDVILSDYSMPQFTAPRALELLQARNLDIPFIIITGTISEEIAVESIKQGAADYLLKDRLGRLGQAVARALDERTTRREKLLTETALRQSEERFRMLVANIPDITWTADRQGRSLFTSPNAERILGYSADEIARLGRYAWHRRIHPEDLERVERAYALLFTENKPFAVEYRVQRSDDEWIWFYDRAISTFEQDATRCAYGICSDITERKKLETQLQQAQRMEAIGRLAGGVAHDFNNMLTVISGISDLLLLRLEPGHPDRQSIEQIRKASERATGLTRQLLAFSRQQVLQPKVLNLNGVVAELHAMLQRLIREDIILLETLHPALGRIKADPGQIEQVIMNLVVNARDAMTGGGTISIETANREFADLHSEDRMTIPPGRYVELAVRDTGCGMDGAVMAQIFEPFFTTKEKGQGTGLGLATVYGIVKQSQGYIGVESELGRGTAFRIYFPRVDEAAEPVAVDMAEEDLTVGHETILLVEDSELVRSLAQNILEMQGYKVLSAAGADEALLFCKGYEGPIQLLLSDIVMPQMHGPEMAGKLLALRPQMRVLFISGYADNELIRYGMTEQNAAFLQKPFTAESLGRKVREVLEKQC